jgi:XTP/dITP diphosphohydrolase
MDLLIGTSNAGKLREIAELLNGLPLRLFSLKDAGLDQMEVAEDADSLEANARLKAEAYARASGLPTLADDTGLFVDALDGRPGIYPARYGGTELTMPQRRALLLNELVGVPVERRTARFIAVIALGSPGGEVQFARGVCEGRIATGELHGESGFGYDPVFIPAGHDISFSQMGEAEKNQISHRGLSVRAAIPLLQAWIERSL